ncbi:serine/threonine protein kinase [Arthrobacter mobilis]|uniref:Protein kinase n=1 Tax=Arthrobacter mobilis TaxID=2724944 RepID=A0A7X6HEF8_9MICC|nr:protein kinase [Arthrobacter mobilis]NKX54915.1 protein kinase [Arthrobacter mobilis]
MDALQPSVQLQQPEPPAGQSGPEPPRPEAAGLRIVRWLGSGASASVWLAAAEDGTEYALKVFTGPDGARGSAGGSGADGEQVLLAGVEHEHLVQAYRQVATSLGPGLLLTFAAGGSLAGLVAARGPLSTGETVTVLTPLGQVLAFLHAQGIAHGDVSPGNVLFTAAGKPLLADLAAGQVAGSAPVRPAATPGFHPGTEAAGPAADVYALAALGWYALTGRVPAATQARPPLGILCPGVPAELAEVLEEGLDDSPAARPAAAEFARRVYRCAAAEPVDLAAAVHPSVVPQLLTRRRPDQRERSGRRRSVPPEPAGAGRTRAGRPRPDLGRLLLAGTALTAGLGLVAALLGMLAGGPGPGAGAAPAAGPAASPGPARPAGRPVPGRISAALASKDPVAALSGLAWLRTEAIRMRSTTLLQDVNVAGSAAMEADRRIMAALLDQDHWFSGLDATVQKAELVAASDTEAEVFAVVSTSAFQEHSAASGLVREVAGPKQQQLTLRLEQSGGRWLVSAVLPPPDPAED